jgi:hypothetical protein
MHGHRRKSLFVEIDFVSPSGDISNRTSPKFQRLFIAGSETHLGIGAKQSDFVLSGVGSFRDFVLNL